MTRFEECFTIVLNMEGGYSNEIDDRGGATNFGVTQSVYTNWLESHGRSHQDVKEIRYEELKDIYASYWKDAKCPIIPKPLDTWVFDTAINSGAKRAIKILQYSLGVTPDGIFGPQTHLALNEEVAAMGVDHVCEIYKEQRKYWYLSIVQRDFTQRKFLTGWLSRLEKLSEVV